MNFLQSFHPELVGPFLGITLLIINLAAVVVMRHLYIEGVEAERLKILSTKYANLVEQERIYRQHHHDLKNHLAVVQGLLKLGKYSELKEYLDSYVHTVDEGLLRIETGSDEVDVLLSSKIYLARSKGVRIDLNIAICLQCGRKHALDLVTILGNVLDNAIDGPGFR